MYYKTSRAKAFCIAEWKIKLSTKNLLINNCDFASVYISLLLYGSAKITFALTIKPVSLQRKIISSFNKKIQQ